MRCQICPRGTAGRSRAATAGHSKRDAKRLANRRGRTGATTSHQRSRSIACPRGARAGSGVERGAPASRGNRQFGIDDQARRPYPSSGKSTTGHAQPLLPVLKSNAKPAGLVRRLVASPA